MQNSKSIMADICKEYLKVAQEEKFEFYRLFSSVPENLYSKYKGKKSKNEIEVHYAASHLKVKDVIAIKFYGTYRTGFYSSNSTHTNDSDEVIRDLNQSQVFSDILWKRHNLKVSDLEKLLDIENAGTHKRFNERTERRWEKPEQIREPHQTKRNFTHRYHKGPRFNVEARIKELKVLMHRNHPDKGGDLNLFIEFSKELADIRN